MGVGGMTRTFGEIDGITLDCNEVNNLHLWLEDYYQTLKGYEDFEIPVRQKQALQKRQEAVLKFIDNLLDKIY